MFVATMEKVSVVENCINVFIIIAPFAQRLLCVRE